MGLVTTVRKALLVPGSHKWNAWVREFTAWLEKPYWPWARAPRYPYDCGDFVIIGPECFTHSDVISWKGENYYPSKDFMIRVDHGTGRGLEWMPVWAHNQYLANLENWYDATDFTD